MGSAATQTPSSRAVTGNLGEMFNYTIASPAPSLSNAAPIAPAAPTPPLPWVRSCDTLPSHRCQQTRHRGTRMHSPTQLFPWAREWGPRSGQRLEAG